MLPAVDLETHGQASIFFSADASRVPSLAVLPQARIMGNL
jgi:hypothetical protein